MKNWEKIIAIYIWFVVQQMYFSLTYPFNIVQHTSSHIVEHRKSDSLATPDNIVWSTMTSCWTNNVRQFDPSLTIHIFHCIFTEFSCSTFSFLWHLYLVLISVFWWKNILLVIFLWKHWNLTKNFDNDSTFKNIQNSDYFRGFCSPEFDCLVRDLAIFRLKCNEQYSSIPKS